MSETKLAYFGKPGSFTHMVAKRTAGDCKLVSRDTVQEVFNYIKKDKTARGIVPVENSSGGMILPTIENLVNDFDLVIQDEYAINVKLALLAKGPGPIKKVYSHFAPFHHCEKWLKEHYPDAIKSIVNSTSEAAKIAAIEPNTAAIAPAATAKKYGLKVLHDSIGDSDKNLTQFFILGHGPNRSQKPRQTSLSVVLKNQVGSLGSFLGPFAKEGINLKRIMSQPLIGQPNNYVFFIGIEAPLSNPAMKLALEAAKPFCKELRVLGSYPVHPPFES